MVQHNENMIMRCCGVTRVPSYTTNVKEDQSSLLYNKEDETRNVDVIYGHATTNLKQGGNRSFQVPAQIRSVLKSRKQNT